MSKRGQGLGRSHPQGGEGCVKIEEEGDKVGEEKLEEPTGTALCCGPFPATPVTQTEQTDWLNACWYTPETSAVVEAVRTH